MKQCRMCEYEFKDKAPVDGLCNFCHINLCQVGPEKCNRCVNLVNSLLDFLYPNDEEKDYCKES